MYNDVLTFVFYCFAQVHESASGERQTVHLQLWDTAGQERYDEIIFTTYLFRLTIIYLYMIGLTIYIFENECLDFEA